MNSFLLTWNPERYSEQDLNAWLDDYDAGREFNWNITAHRQAKEGDYVFFYKQGPAPNGIFAAGTISGPPTQSDNLEDDRWYFPIEFLRKVKPWEQFLLTRDECLEFLTLQQLSAQASGFPTHLLQPRLEQLLARIDSDEKPLTVDDLKAALLAVGLTEREKRALIALWQLPDSSGTAEEVATQADFAHPIEASNSIGAIGNKLAKFFDQPKPGQGEPGYLFIADDIGEAGHTVWYLLDDICEAIEQLGWVEPALPPEVQSYHEGEVSLVKLTRYERSPAAREAALKTHGYVCSACGFDFEAVYGERGRHFIEVHHLEPLGEAAYPRHTDPEHDLRPVCSNCHRMIHRGESMLSIEQMREITDRNRLVVSHYQTDLATDS
jgi:5-methylcytosine-specific restriction enzyme A